jgi:Aspartyl protease
MRLNGDRQESRWPRLPRAIGRLLAVTAALGALALAIGACSLTSGSPGGGGGFSTDTSGSVTAGTGGTTQVKILHGGGGTAMVLVPLTIGGEGPYDFALDTGAGITLIDTQLANQLDLSVTGDPQQVTGVGGSQQITPVHIDSWSAGDITLPSADVGRTELASFNSSSGVRGLLGSDILSRFGRVTINYDTGELSVAPPPASQGLRAPAVAPLVAILRESPHLLVA